MGIGFGDILKVVGGGLLGGIPGAIGGAVGGAGGALGGAGLGGILAALLGKHGESGGGQQPEPFHNGFVDQRPFDPSGAGISYKGGGGFDIPGYEMFGDLIPVDTPSKSINGIPTEVFREQRAQHYGGTPQDYGAPPSAGGGGRFGNYGGQVFLGGQNPVGQNAIGKFLGGMFR